MRVWICLFVLRFGTAIKLSSVEPQSLLSIAVEPVTDSRLPFPSNLDYTRLFCFDESPGSSPPSSFVAETFATKSSTLMQRATVTACKTNTDCPSATSHCLGGFCRECRYATDCPDVGGTPQGSLTSTATFCSADTGYACSECVADTDCLDGKICRSVFSDSVNRKRCLPCSAGAVPVDAVVKTTNTCDWFCESATDMIGPDGSCQPCPICKDGEMLVPTSDFARSTPNYFFPQCAFSSSPKCISCPGRDNPCAEQLTPTSDWTGVAGVAKLAPQYPCGTFRCKPDWYLDASKNQCRKCDYRRCPAGQMLVGCRDGSAGACQACPANTLGFIDPRDMSVPITRPDDACRPACPSNTYLARLSLADPWQCAACGTDAQCPPGYMFSGCGGASPGGCLKCGTSPLPGTFWTGSGCSMSVCDFKGCAAGTVLVNCGGASAGACQTCPDALPENAVSYKAVFDEITLTDETCAVQCKDGYFTKREALAKFSCAACDASQCAAGQQLIGCAGDSPGTCEACPTPRPGFFLNLTATAPCTMSKCPVDSAACPAGERFAGCGGSSPGACVSCGTLPATADAWLANAAGSKLECPVRCKADHVDELSLDGRGNTCTPCATIATGCAVGQRLVGCSATSRGVCESCPAIGVTEFWNGQSNCASSSCQGNCAAGMFAQGCGLGSAGTCTACGGLPSYATAVEVADNVCRPICAQGAYRTPTNVCDACNLSRCPNGQVLTSCGGVSQGTCSACTPPATGMCFTGYGMLLGSLDSCPTAPCPSA